MIYDKAKQRERLLQILSEAPTEILLNAVQDLQAFKVQQANAMTSVFKYFGDGKPKEDGAPHPIEQSPSKTESVGKTPDEIAYNVLTKTPKYITPPFEPSAKIGSEAEAGALGWLRNGPADIESLAVAMKRSTAQAGPLLARLVQKGKIKYRSDKLFEI